MIDPEPLQSLYILPGMLGDDLGFRAFSESLRGDYAPVILRHRDGDGAHGLEHAARSLASRIRDLQPEGPVGLLGYSYGANLAFEAAHLLLRQGREVAPLVMVDPALPTTEFGVFDGTPARAVERCHNRPGLLVRLMRRRSVWALMRILPDRRITRKIRKGMHIRMRRWARRGWRPRTLDVPGLMVISTQLHGATAAGLAELCPRMDTMVVEARHLDVLSGLTGGAVARAVSGLRARPPHPITASIRNGPSRDSA